MTNHEPRSAVDEGACDEAGLAAGRGHTSSSAPCRVFIGYDPREHDAFEVCAYSIRRHASIEVSIRALDQSELRGHGLYYRQTVTRGDRMIDAIDGKAFSTGFAFTRFLVPALCDFTGWALFMDGDMMLRRDIAELWAMRRERYAVMCVHHDHRPPEKRKKDGAAQEAYPRKNWSSLVLWNCGHPANAGLTPEIVNAAPGRFLHGFEWLTDAEIGELPEEWNWLEGWSLLRQEATEGEPSGASAKEGEPCEALAKHGPANVHFTRGGPWLDEWRDVAYAGEWLALRSEMRLGAYAQAM